MRFSVRLMALAGAMAGCHSGVEGVPLSAPVYEGSLPCAGHAATRLAHQLLVGFSSDSDVTASKPGFALRYRYIAGDLAPSADCYDAARTNTVGCGTSGALGNGTKSRRAST
jgi:hypothetical protein